MAVQILKRIFFSTLKPMTKPKPKTHSLSQFSTSSSPPSDDQPNNLISTVVSLLTHHRSKSRWNHLLSLCPSSCLTPSQFSQIAIGLKNNPHLALRFFSFTQHKSLCKHSLSSYATMIHILSRGRLIGPARDIIRVALRSPENEPKLKLFQVLVKTYRECGSAPFVFDLLIKCCLEVKNIEKIETSIDIVRMLMSRGLSIKVSTCNALIWEVSRSKGVNSGYDIYREVFGLDREGIEGIGENVKRIVKIRPNVHTFNALMVCFYREGAFEKVEDLWIEMARFGCEPDCYSYSILMAVFCDEGRMREAEKLWEEMRDKNVEHDVVAYNTIIGGFCETGEMVRAEEFFKEMGLSGVESSCPIFEHLVNGYCRIGNIGSAILVYKDMCRKDFRPEGSTIELLIGGLCDNRRVSEALEILKTGVLKFGFFPRKKCYMFLIKGLCEEGKMEEALKVQAEMVGKGFEPSLEIYNVFIDGYMKQGNMEKAAILRKEMFETRMEEENG